MLQSSAYMMQANRSEHMQVNTYAPKNTEGPLPVADSQWRFVLPIRRTVVANGKKTPGYVLELENQQGTKVTFECVEGYGGLVTAFKLNGENVQVDEAVGPSQVWGTSFWPSPQSAWGWPPPPAFNSANYTAEVNESGRSVTLTGPVDEGLGVQVVKHFVADLVRGSIDLNYEMRVPSGSPAAPQRLAAWEITRLKPEGVLFWKGGALEKSGNWPKLLVEQLDVDGVDYYHYNLSLSRPVANKSEFGNYEGKVNGQGPSTWLAMARPGVLFVKRFAPVAPAEAAPGEAQVELYSYAGSTNPRAVYTEMEQQGAFVQVDSGHPLRYRTEWILRPLPSDLGVEELVSCGPCSDLSPREKLPDTCVGTLPC